MHAGGRLRFGLVLAAVILLAGAGLARYAGLTDEAAAARSERAELRSRIRQARDTAGAVSNAAETIEADNRALDRELAGLRRAADNLIAQIQTVRRARADAALNAWLTATQINALRECLNGVNRALNQTSVGDTRATASLTAVRSACEAAGA